MSEQELLESMNMNTITDSNGDRHMLSVPLTLSISKEQREELAGQDNIAVTWGDDIVATIHEPEFFDNRKEEIATKTFGTRSLKHPRIKVMEEEGDFLISGKRMRFTQRIRYADGLDKYRMTPQEIKKIAEEREADALYAFQVRNPLHNGHCLLLNDTRQ